LKGASRPLPLSIRGGGFTLIELLIAMAVVAITAVIAVPMYTRYVAQARQQDAKVQLTAIRQAEEMYRLQYGTYTNNLANLNFSWRAPTAPPHRYTYSVLAGWSATTFTARATGNIDGDATIDTWTIDENDALTPTIDDVAG
jgi:type IV pilus assembly protein PilE